MLLLADWFDGTITSHRYKHRVQIWRKCFNRKFTNTNFSLQAETFQNQLKNRSFFMFFWPYLNTAIENLSLIWNMSAFVTYFFKNPKKLQPNALPYTLHFLTFTRLQPLWIRSSLNSYSLMKTYVAFLLLSEWFFEKLPKTQKSIKHPFSSKLPSVDKPRIWETKRPLLTSSITWGVVAWSLATLHF